MGNKEYVLWGTKPDETLEDFICAFTTNPTYEDIADLKKWADDTWDKLDKCPQCGEPLPDERERWSADDWSGKEYCSEDCARRVAEHNEQVEAKYASEV